MRTRADRRFSVDFNVRFIRVGVSVHLDIYYVCLER